jgi:hemerythrin-like metal-binding protein
MSELQWSDALVMDLPVMDQTHREFVDLLAAVADADDDRLVPAWSALIDHTDAHFAQEDRWMRETRFASTNCHTTQHHVVLGLLREGLALGRIGKRDVIRVLAHELATWFPSHAQSMDAALALHLRRVGLDPVTGAVARPECLPVEEIHGCGSASCTPA